MAGCAIPTTSATHAPAGAKADPKLTFNADHLVGADHRRGDPKAACRRERDAAASALAQLLAPGQPLEEQARIVVDRVARYQPVAGKLGADRQLMDQIKAAGLPLPSADRVARIIRSAANKRNEGRQVGS